MGLFILENATGRPSCSLPAPEEGVCKKNGERLFSRACFNRTGGNGFKLKEGRFGLDIKRLFMQ